MQRTGAAPFVAVVEPADLSDGDDLAGAWRFRRQHTGSECPCPVREVDDRRESRQGIAEGDDGVRVRSKGWRGQGTPRRRAAT